MEKILSAMDIKRVDHLAIINSFCNKLDLVNVVNSQVKSEMNVKPGVIVQGMVLDTLSGRSPLYHLEEFFADVDVELLLGEGVQTSDFNDTIVGRTMDRIYNASTMKIFSELAYNATGLFSIDMKYLHYDTTSVNVWGDYEICEQLDGVLNITHGHSKDHRPDLKQFLVEMLCVDKNIPIMGRCLDGSSSDKKNNNKVLTNISQWMAKHGLAPGAFIYIADSALITEKNLNAMQNNLFISRLPFNYNECNRIVEQAIERNVWTEVGVLAQTKAPKNKPHARYKLYDDTVELYGKTYRAVVVHSSAHNQRRIKRIEKEIDNAKKQLAQKIKEQTKTAYYCLPDAQKAAEQLEKLKTSSYHQITTQINEQVKYEKGRPAKNRPRKIKETTYVIEANIVEVKDTIDKKKKQAGCFVLLTNVPKQGHELAHSAKEILVNYKEQHGVERNFGFLKDPLIVNDIFLKNPWRIEVLGMILLISLLIWNLIERTLRCFIQKENATITGWDNKQTVKPTAFMMTTKFTGDSGG
jgi:transposase